MTVKELHEKYGFDKDATIAELIERHKSDKPLHPIYEKHRDACWIIQEVWMHVSNVEMSMGKARELTAAIIEEHINNLNAKQNDNN